VGTAGQLLRENAGLIEPGCRRAASDGKPNAVAAGIRDSKHDGDVIGWADLF